TFIVSGFIKRITPDFTIIEITDVDFVTTNANVIQNAQPNLSSVVSEHPSDIDLIAEDTNSTMLRTPKRLRGLGSNTFDQDTSTSSIINESPAPLPNPMLSTDINAKTVQIQKGKKKLSDLALRILEPIDDVQDQSIRSEDMPEDDELEILDEQL
ncbi:11508_t:CDS:1, partial [Racocetra fulgida]